MAAREPDAIDWRDAAAYRPLLAADRSVFAWEWLRRDPGYRKAAERAARSGVDDGLAAGEWGLHAFVPPHLGAPLARPVWSALVNPFVLGVDAVFDASERFDLARFRAFSTLVAGEDGREHLLLSDGLRVIRVDVLGGALADGRSGLRYHLSGLGSAEPPLLTLRRLLALWRTGHFSRTLHPPETRAARWVLILRAYDGLSAGADQRDIAAVLFRAEAAAPNWRTETPSLRSRAQRLVRAAGTTAGGAYWDLLGRPPARRR